MYLSIYESFRLQLKYNFKKIIGKYTLDNLNWF